MHPFVGLAEDLNEFVSIARNMNKGWSLLPHPEKIKALVLKFEPQLTGLQELFKRKSPHPSSIYDPSEFGIEITKDESLCRKVSQHPNPDACYIKETNKIYLILPQLKRYPNALLPSVVYPLIVHEMAHKANLSEEEANLLQKYFSQFKEIPPCTIEWNFYRNEKENQSNSEFIGGRISIKFEEANQGFAKQSLEIQTYDFGSNIMGIAGGGYISNFTHARYNENAQYEFPRRQEDGGFKVKWEKDFSGSLEFDTLDTVGSELKVVRNKINWSSPKINNIHPRSIYGGYIAELTKGTEATFKGNKFIYGKDGFDILFFGNCFPKK